MIEINGNVSINIASMRSRLKLENECIESSTYIHTYVYLYIKNKNIYAKYFNSFLLTFLSRVLSSRVARYPNKPQPTPVEDANTTTETSKAVTTFDVADFILKDGLYLINFHISSNGALDVAVLLLVVKRSGGKKRKKSQRL